MSKIAVVFWSGTGNTEAMAGYIAEGAKSLGSEVSLFHPGAFSADMVNDFDAIAFGCPAMGAEELEDSEFEPMFDAVKSSLSGKKIALFGSYDWGDEEWIRTWAQDCEDSGCLLVDQPLAVHNAPEVSDKSACRALGEKLAR